MNKLIIFRIKSFQRFLVAQIDVNRASEIEAVDKRRKGLLYSRYSSGSVTAFRCLHTRKIFSKSTCRTCDAMDRTSSALSLGKDIMRSDRFREVSRRTHRDAPVFTCLMT